MSLEALKSRRLKSVQWAGETFHFVKMSAQDGATLQQLYSTMQVNELGQPTSEVDLSRFYAYVLSKCLVSDSGEKIADSDEMRESFRTAFAFEDVVGLGEIAAEWSGIAGDQSKKNLASTSVSSTASVSLPENLTPTPYLTASLPSKC